MPPHGFVHSEEYHPVDASGSWDMQMGGMQGSMAEGRMIVPIPGQAPGIISTVETRRGSIVSSHLSHDGEDDSGEFVPVPVDHQGHPLQHHHQHQGQHQHHMHPHSQGDFDSSAFTHGTPFHLSAAGPSSTPHTMAYEQTPIMGSVQTSPLMQMGHATLPALMSPTDAMHMHHAQFSTPGAGPSSTPSHFFRPPHDQPHRPGMPHRHSAVVGAPRPAPLHRQYSLQVPPGRPTPQMIANDVFAVPSGVTPARRGGSMASIDQRQPAYEFHGGDVAVSIWRPGRLGGCADHFQYFHQTPQGISPARALGPAPVQPHRFSPHQGDPLVTPQPTKAGYPGHIHSSATSSTAMSHSTISMASSSPETGSEGRSHRHRPSQGSSDDENDSPTKGPSASRAMRGMQLNEPGPPPGALPPKRMPMQARAVRLPTSKPSMVGGRTSAKFAKVAEDPGVEGVPPGPRPLDRPAPSFACIIGQAILRSSAGGLSLEHIYRYVETAYPFFKNGDGAWRNSVRHNLSIHKMFETIPRTEKFPPGKGGIWIIHEEEKCHWPAEDKFIKNFPSSHHHHADCRQTLHERQKEMEAIAKARAEGREYVPKKGKKGRKLAMDDGSIEMVRSSSSLSDAPTLLPPPPVPTNMPAAMTSMLPPDVTPRMASKQLAPPQLEPSDFEDDGDFLPIEPESQSDEVQSPAAPKLEPDLSSELQTSPAEPRSDPQSSETPMPRGTMIPPRFGKDRERKEKRRGLEDDENVFTTAKRVRVAEPEPLAPIVPHPQETVAVVHDADSYVTPERERNPSNQNKPFISSNFRTPALVNGSSSPVSSPMPPTVGRSAHGHHHPSSLQQAWTHDDMTDDPAVALVSVPDSSPPRRPTFSLDAAFDIKPKSTAVHGHAHGHGGHLVNRRKNAADDDHLPLHASPRGPPKTPLSRSSAAIDRDRTPRPHFGAKTGGAMHTPFAKTPMWAGGSPILPLPAGGELSTPAWEMNGVLDRLKGCMESPTRGPMGIRSPMPSTDPTRYAILLDSGSPKARGRA